MSPCSPGSYKIRSGENFPLKPPAVPVAELLLLLTIGAGISSSAAAVVPLFLLSCPAIACAEVAAYHGRRTSVSMNQKGVI